MKIYFATSNAGKIKTLSRYLAPHGFEVESAAIDFTEPQLDSIEDIARAKAIQAYDILKAPVVVQDTGFSIAALNGFPGPYARYANEKLGADGYLKLMQGLSDRRCHFIGAIAYADANGKITLFTENGPAGIIADCEDAHPLNEKAWSVLWKIYIPDGQQASLNAMSDHERENWYAHGRGRSHFSDFADWLADKYNMTPHKKAV